MNTKHPQSFLASLLLPVLTGVYFILAFYSDNIRHFPVSVTLLPLALVVGITVLVYILCLGFLRNNTKAALLTAAIIGLNLSYGRLCDLFPKAFYISIGSRTFAANIIMFPLIGLILLVTAITVWIIRVDVSAKIARFLRLVVVLLCIMSVVQIVFYSRNRLSLKQYSDSPAKANSIQTQESPHILYLVLDGYARGDILKTVFNYDNATFYDRLNKMGFYVASNALANYCFTPLSQASTLNMDYLDKLADLPKDTDDRSLVIRLIENNKVSKTLQDAGYHVFTTKSMYRATETFKGAQNVSDNEFHRELLHRLWAYQFLRVANAGTYKYDEKRANLNETFELIPTLLERKSPHFIYSHVLFPHNPFVFKRDGTPFNPAYNVGESDPFEPEKYKVQYLEQLIYTSSEVLKLLEKCMERTERPLVILVQSDHGSYATINWNDIDKSNVLERFGILNALYYSEGPLSSVSQSLSAVNNFRVLFNNIFQTSFPILPTRCYFSNAEKFYNFTDATDRIEIND